MAKLLSGIEVRDALLVTMKEQVATFTSKPTLVILQVGNRADSTSYIRQKKLLGEKIGVEVIIEQFSESISQVELYESIVHFNQLDTIHGIILQLPLPEHLNKNELINSIDPKKDVDGLTEKNTQLFFAGDADALIPATAKGVLTLLSHYDIPIEGKKVTVIGNSDLVGKPIAVALEQKGADITICDITTKDLVPFTKQADIIVVATGHAKLITKEHVSAGQTIVDVGITVYEYDGKRNLVGDVYFEQVEPIVAAISPVPGGVGPMTVISLFQNLLKAYGHVLRNE